MTPGPGSAERGFTLVELLVTVAIVILVAGLAFESLAARPAQTRATAVAFAQLIAQARALAATSAGSGVAAGSGATIGVVRTGSGVTATLYAFRPMSAAADQPVRAANAPPLQTTTPVALEIGGALLEPPFALFFSASGDASAAAPFTVGVDAPLSAEPPCSVATGIVLEFGAGQQSQAYALSCQMAILDVDAPLANAAPLVNAAPR